MTKRRPRVLTKCVADYYANRNGSGKRIIEFAGTEPDQGGLISFRQMPDGTLRVEVYRTDAKVTVITPTPQGT